MPSRGGDSLSILHTFVNPHVNFIDYRAMLGAASVLRILNF
jgi:hypothetical protein